MKKLFIAFSLLALSVGQVAAQTDSIPTEVPAPAPAWKFSGVSGLNLAQTSLTNWAAGGENSVAWNLYLNASANYKKGDWSWDNALITDFGKTFTTSNKWLKSVDKLNFSTKVGRNISKHWSISALGDFLTQFARGYDSDTNPNIPGNKDKYISTLLAPGYLTLAIGADYKPNEDFSLLLSPITGKMTFVLDNRLSAAGAFGVMLGYMVGTPQGAFSFTPLIMAFTVFNTAMMPRDMYAPALRPAVDVSPVTVVSQLVDTILFDQISVSHVAVFLCWFGGIAALSVLVLIRRVKGARR